MNNVDNGTIEVHRLWVAHMSDAQDTHQQSEVDITEGVYLQECHQSKYQRNTWFVSPLSKTCQEGEVRVES